MCSLIRTESTPAPTRHPTHIQQYFTLNKLENLFYYFHSWCRKRKSHRLVRSFVRSLQSASGASTANNKLRTDANFLPHSLCASQLCRVLILWVLNNPFEKWDSTLAWDDFGVGFELRGKFMVFWWIFFTASTFIINSARKFFGKSCSSSNINVNLFAIFRTQISMGNLCSTKSVIY